MHFCEGQTGRRAYVSLCPLRRPVPKRNPESLRTYHGPFSRAKHLKEFWVRHFGRNMPPSCQPRDLLKWVFTQLLHWQSCCPFTSIWALCLIIRLAPVVSPAIFKPTGMTCKAQSGSWMCTVVVGSHSANLLMFCWRWQNTTFSKTPPPIQLSFIWVLT